MRLDLAPAVGHGIPRLRAGDRGASLAGAVKEALDVVKSDDTEPVDQGDLTDDWQDKPAIPNQIGDPRLYKVVGQTVLVFDLSDDTQREAYSQLLTRSRADDTNLFVHSSETKFCESTSNWKVLVHTVTIKYRNIIKNRPKK